MPEVGGRHCRAQGREPREYYRQVASLLPSLSADTGPLLFPTVDLLPPRFRFRVWRHRRSCSEVSRSSRLFWLKDFSCFTSLLGYTDHGKEERSGDPLVSSLPGLLARCRAPPFAPHQRYRHRYIVADGDVRLIMSLNQAGDGALLPRVLGVSAGLLPILLYLPGSTGGVSCSGEGRNFNIFPNFETFSNSRAPWKGSIHALFNFLLNF